MFNINLNFFKKCFLFLIIFYLFLPNLYSVKAEEAATIENFGDFKDLDKMSIQMDAETGNVYIPEVREIQKKGGEGVQNAWNFAYDRFQEVIVGFSGLCTLTFVLIFLVTFVKIGAADANPQKKAELSKALVWIGLGAAGFGSVTLFLGLAFGLFS